MATKLALLGGRFALGEALPASGESQAYRALDERTGHAVVVKLVPARNRAACARLLGEFERLAELDHPALPAVIEVGQTSEGPDDHGVFLAIELVAGPNAAEACAQLSGSTRSSQVARILSDAAAALEALHERGLVHHDVKPSHLVAAADGHFRLIDLGLVRPAGMSDGSARGTLAYLSPEALAGASDFSVDLFALGVTAYELLSGRLPYGADSPGALLKAQGRPRDSLVGPAALVSLIDALLEVDPGRRPSRARLVAEELARAGLATPRGLAPATPRRLGRSGHVASSSGRSATLRALDQALERATLVLLVGPAGSGRSRLVVELDRQRALAALRAGARRPFMVGPTLEDGARALGIDCGEDRVALRGKVVDRLLADDGLLYLGASDSTEVIGLWQALGARDDRRGPARLLVELDEQSAAGLLPRLLPAGVVQRVDVPPLDDDEVAELCARLLGPVPPELSALAARLSRGSPRLLIDLLRAADARAAGRGQGIGLVDLRAVRVEALGDELARVIELVPGEGRALLAALAMLGRPASLDELRRGLALSAIGPAFAALDREHLLAWGPEGVAVESVMVGHAALAALPARALSAIGARLLAMAEEAGALLDGARLARALGRSDASVRAAKALRALLDGAPAAGRAPSLEESVALARSVPGALGARLSGELLLAAAEYPRAVTALEEAAQRTAPRDLRERAQIDLLRARALRAAGTPDEAERLARALAQEDEEAAALARVLLARLHLDRGDAARASVELARLAHAPDDSWGRAEYHEVRGVAALQSGELGIARLAFSELQRVLVQAPAARRARAEALLGMVAQAEGALEESAAAYGRALRAAEEGADLHGAAIYAQNLGGSLRELGEHARALPALERATQVLARVGRDEEQALALFNLGGVHLALGDLDAASTAAERAATSESQSARRYGELLTAEVERRRDELPAALERYDALLQADPGRDRGDTVLVLAARAEVLAESGADEARAALQELTRAAPTATPALQRHAALAEARVRLVLDPAAPLPEALRSALGVAAHAAEQGRRRDFALRTHVLLLRDAIRRGARDEVAIHLDSARRHHEEIRMRTPELRRAALSDDPDIRRLVALSEAAERAPSDTPPIRRLVEINKRLNSELDLDRLLELILDTVIELSRAERGFLLLRAPEGGPLEIRLERNVELAARAGAAAFSHSIAERAVAEGEPIVTIDAADDRRFEAALSVVDLRLRSVLAVPLQVKGRVVGCVYVDHRARVGLFRPNDVALVVDLAEQAAIAIENARLLVDNRDKANQVRALNAALQEKVASQSVELEGMHREVREARRSLGVRHDYAGLIGQTPRMVELFRLLDRVTDTALPVVIYGESGTGKELVARAIHHNGPRRKAAFVSESCAAIPETLLEAALFGHVRGAFTGAQGERRGLFEIADGGTLFLDEVGEMSAGMQVRLLRVLQEGEFRRVGGEKLLKVDVRVLVASNSDLGRLVEEGRFREDLFYRLNVVRVALPPLRERPADIPLLAEHFLAQRPGAKGVTRRALDRLMAYGWPGNVRQLENEIARACSMADGPVDLADLSPQVQAGTDAAQLDGPEPLDLHARVERLERGLLTEALSRSGGNQSEAARLLGLSRFGLQKKLRRYSMRAAPAPVTKRARAR